MNEDKNPSWLKDGVIELERVIKKSMLVTPSIVNIPLEKAGTYGVVTPSPSGEKNEISFKLAGPSWHSESLASPKQMIDFIQSMQDRGIKPSDGAVYISDDSIVYVYSFEDRRDLATCPLTETKPWSWISESQQPLSQREIVRLLRITFDGCLAADSSLISTLRNVKWKNDGGVEANLQRGKEALGKSIVNEILGVSNFPDEFSLNLNVFEFYKRPVRVRVALEIIPDAQKFELIPIPSQIADGLAETLRCLQQEIEATGVPTFIGAVE